MTKGESLTVLVLATSIVLGLPTTASAQALLSDQRDVLAHAANAAVAAAHCRMSVDEQLLDAALTDAGLAWADLEAEPYKSTLGRATQEAQASIEASGRDAVCERLEAMYGATGFRLPGVLAR